MSQPTQYRAKPTEAPIWVSEPFRVFFPLGVAASIFGVLSWPLFYAGWWPFAPHLQHPRIMVFGFGFAFVAGFLGTAWPRFLEAEALRRIELTVLVITWLIAQLFYALHQLRAGDAAFAAHALALFAILSLRLRGRGRELPPPGFLLAFVAVFLAFCVALAWAIWGLGLPPRFVLFAKLIAWQGILLFPLLGVGSYLFARFFQTPGQRPPAASPKQRALGVWLTTLLVLVSFGIEACGWIRAGNFLRFGATVLWAVLAAPAIRKGRAPTTRAWGLRIAIASIAASFLARGVWPGPAYALEHILFLAGFGLAMLLVADRVSIGHGGGDFSAIPAKSTFWRWLIWLTLLAAATRASADMKASMLISHHIYAALLWAIILGIWTAYLAKFWRSGER